MTTIATNFEIIDAYYCPITGELMQDPVIDPEGHSYERNAIVTWLHKNPISPITRSPLDITRLRPNRALKESIDQIRSMIDASQLKKITPLAQKCSAEMIQILQNSLDNISLNVINTMNQIHVEVDIPDSNTRAPVNMVLVIDVSASMGSEATMKNDQGQEESHGFSLLDIVKQASHTVRVCLNEKDCLSIVSYSREGTVVQPPTAMDQTGNMASKVAIDSLHPDANTNIWDGLLKALDLCKNSSSPERVNKILLLTDGQPNVIPPRGHVGMLRKYRDSNGELPASVDTFGFGYNLDSVDLNNIAQECMGSYGFIPDSAMVGDLFSNCLASVLSTASPQSQIMLELPEGFTLDPRNPVMANHTYELTSWGIKVDLGSLHYGQRKWITFNLQNYDVNNISDIVATVKYDHFNEFKQLSKNCLPNTVSLQSGLEVTRQQFVEVVSQAWQIMRSGDIDCARTMIKALIDDIKASNNSTNAYIKDLLIDLQEQVSIAFSKSEYWEKWGKHYIPSLVRAHQLQRTNNFKDPGVQHYAGPLFTRYRDDADDNYNKLPAPTPSANVSRGYGSSHLRSMPAPTTMASYNTRGGVCFHGDCIVQLFNGNQVKVSEVTAGMKVLTSNKDMNYQDTIECVLKTVFKNKKTLLVTLENGWKGTPWHPIKTPGGWKFPCDLAPPLEEDCLAVYSFVLKNRSMLYINGTESATLGHGISDDPVISHPYFGTEHVVNDLKEDANWESGVILIVPECIIRDKKTGLVNQIVPWTNSDMANYFVGPS